MTDHTPLTELRERIRELEIALEAVLFNREDGRNGKCGFCGSDVYECDRYDTASTACAGWMARTAMRKEGTTLEQAAYDADMREQYR